MRRESREGWRRGHNPERLSIRAYGRSVDETAIRRSVRAYELIRFRETEASPITIVAALIGMLEKPS